MKRRELESILQDVQTFENPKVELEQYPTSAHIAACMLHIMAGQGDVEDRAVVDLGCGGGILSLGSAILGSRWVVGVDIDSDALQVASRNVEELGTDDVEFVLGDVRDGKGGWWREFGGFDTVVMNPPFGTRDKGADMEFLQAAFRLVPHGGVIYSLHKSSTRDLVGKVGRSSNTVRAEVLAQLKFDIPKLYRFHKKESVDIEVDFWRIEVKAAMS